MNFADCGVRPITASISQDTFGTPSGSSTLTMPQNFGSSSVPRGMWHQFGLPTRNPTKGIFLEMDDIPATWLKNHYEVVTGSSPYNNFTPIRGFNMHQEMKSFSKLMGFREENSSAKLGELADSQVIREAVVAVPYVIEGLTPGEQQPSGQNAQTRKKFINIPKKRFNAALSDGSLAGNSLTAAGASIRKMIEAMETYVFPPQFDFMALPASKRKPIVMYVFEFEYQLDKNDLSYIWQNLAPPSYTNTRFEEKAVAHALAGPELLTEYNLLTNPNLRWMVFKVKQRGQSLYTDMVTTQAGEPTRRAAWELPWAGHYPRTQTFNWPYDYVSIVESIKVDVDVKFDRNEQSTPLRTMNRSTIGKQNQSLSKAQRRKKQFDVNKKK